MGFVKERKTKKDGAGKRKEIKTGVLHKIPNPLTGNEWVIIRVVLDGG
jgi:hypothetical protein